VRKRENFGRISERYRTFTGRVECGEQEDKEGNQTKMRLAILRNEETHSCCKQRPSHLREGEEQQGSTTERINGPNGWPCEQEIHKAKAP
jgi:hypothetical protein